MEQIREKKVLSEGKKQASKHVEEELFTQTQYKSFFAAELEKSTQQSREKLSANDSYRSRNVTHRPRSTASMGETVTSVSDRVRRFENRPKSTENVVGDRRKRDYTSPLQNQPKITDRRKTPTDFTQSPLRATLRDLSPLRDDDDFVPSGFTYVTYNKGRKKKNNNKKKS